MQRSDRIAHLEAQAIDTAAGALAGAAIGAIGGPIGLAAGAAIGAAIGVAVGLRQDEVIHNQTLHDRELDAIGVVPPTDEEYEVHRSSLPPPAPTAVYPEFPPPPAVPKVSVTPV